MEQSQGGNHGFRRRQHKQLSDGEFHQVPPRFRLFQHFGHICPAAAPPMIKLGPGPDRIIDEVYVWICVDPATGLEGICGVALDKLTMQAVTSNKETALKLLPFIERLKAGTSMTFRLVRFQKQEVVLEL